MSSTEGVDPADDVVHVVAAEAVAVVVAVCVTGVLLDDDILNINETSR